MARRNESVEEKERRNLVAGFLKDNPIKDPNDIQELMRVKTSISLYPKLFLNILHL